MSDGPSDLDPDEVIPFGQHAGMGMQEIVETDPDYVQWLLKQDWFWDRFPKQADLMDSLADEWWDDPPGYRD